MSAAVDRAGAVDAAVGSRDFVTFADVEGVPRALRRQLYARRELLAWLRSFEAGELPDFEDTLAKYRQLGAQFDTEHPA